MRRIRLDWARGSTSGCLRARLAVALGAAIASLSSIHASALPTEDHYRKAVESSLSVSALRGGRVTAPSTSAGPDPTALILVAEGALLYILVQRDRAQSRE
jgi:hypothetical protein